MPRGQALLPAPAHIGEQEGSGKRRMKGGMGKGRMREQEGDSGQGWMRIIIIGVFQLSYI